MKRTKQLEGLRQEVQQQDELNAQRSQKLQEMIFDDLRRLEQAIEAEKDAREQADDDIVVALKQYTVALQNALASGNLDSSDPPP